MMNFEEYQQGNYIIKKNGETIIKQAIKKEVTEEELQKMNEEKEIEIDV